MTKLWLIRHGEAHVNHLAADGSYQLHDEHGLTERGVEQAVALGRRLVAEGVKPDAVICSSFERACQTANIVCEQLGIEPKLSDEVQEWRPGTDLSTIAVAEAEASWRRILAGEDHDARLSPQSESHREFCARVDKALAEIADAHLGTTVLVFTHGGVVDRSFVSFLGVPARKALLGLRTKHTSITEWQRPDLPHLRDWPDSPDEPTWVLARYNDAAHLEPHQQA
jgi:probable phosphoglycerate mutase